MTSINYIFKTIYQELNVSNLVLEIKISNKVYSNSTDKLYRK